LKVDIVKLDWRFVSCQYESSLIDPTKEERIRTLSWLLVVGGKKNGRIYEIGEVIRTKHREKLTYHGTSIHSHDS